MKNSIDNLAAGFENPDPQNWGPVPIWWWSGARLERPRLRWQMEQMLSQGVAQAVIMNLAPTGPLYGSLADDPAFMSESWWEIFLGACEDARELGFKFWPYDQIGFSGANFQGALVSRNPEWAGYSLDRIDADTVDGTAELDVPQDSEPLLAYAVDDRSDTAVVLPLHSQRVLYCGDATRIVLLYSQRRGFNYYDREAVAALFGSVHGEFERHAGHFFGDVITGFFQDELPEMPMWNSDFRQSFLDRHGYDIIPRLGALWGDPIPSQTADTQARLLRIDYETHRAHLAKGRTFGQLSAWLGRHDLQSGFDQQSPAREGDPSSSVLIYGDYLETHDAFSAPGSDHLGDPKVHSSLSHLNGGTRTWIEAFHSSGWGGTLEETYDWLTPFLARGATLYDPHAVYYATPGGWWEWAPPSTCWRQPYWSEYGILASTVARLSQLLSAGQLVTDLVLLFPTTDAQANTGLGDSFRTTLGRGAAYHALNGTTAWSSEEPGVLDRAGQEYEIVSDKALRHATMKDGAATLAGAQFRRVVVPGAGTLDGACADLLADLAHAGGTVILAGRIPNLFPGSKDDGARFLRLVETQEILAITDPEDVPAELGQPAQRVDAPVPSLLKRVADGYVLALFAHDASSGTEQPILHESRGYIDWIENGWESFWTELRARGYNYRPVRDRRITVTLHGIAGDTIETWDPTTGRRRRIASRPVGANSVEIDVEFEFGSTSVLVIPDHTSGGLPLSPPDQLMAEIGVGGFEVEAISKLDNEWGDFASASRKGILPIEVWHLETAEGDNPPTAAWRPAIATFGHFAELAGPGDLSLWTPAEWSLSRGIFKDPTHNDTLGPKGYVPEEFLHWPTVGTGERVAMRTWVDVPAAGLSLVVGANAIKTISIDDQNLPAAGNGYWASAPLPQGRHHLRLDFEAEREEFIRASFAIVADTGRYERPEWLAPEDGSIPASTVVFTTTFELTDVPQDARIQVGSEQPCVVIVNGAEAGRQSAFQPYGQTRFGRFHPYDISAQLGSGPNTVEMRCSDSGRTPSIMLDSVPMRQGGLGLVSGRGRWAITRDGNPRGTVHRSQQWQDPRFGCLTPRPHPLPAARWLEQPEDDAGVVVPVVPDLDCADTRARWLRCTLPLGTVTVRVPSAIQFRAHINGTETPIGHDRLIRLATPAIAGTVVALQFEPVDGRRGGALLDEPLTVETVPAPLHELADWTALGLGSFAGELVYRTTLTIPGTEPTDRLELDLGSVRGSVHVEIDGRDAGRLAWSPYRLDLTDATHGKKEVTVAIRVHNTLAGYYSASTPTLGVFAGQTRGGIYGPVTLRHFRRTGPK